MFNSLYVVILKFSPTAQSLWGQCTKCLTLLSPKRYLPDFSLLDIPWISSLLQSSRTLKHLATSACISLSFIKKSTERSGYVHPIGADLHADVWVAAFGLGGLCADGCDRIDRLLLPLRSCCSIRFSSSPNLSIITFNLSITSEFVVRLGFLADLQSLLVDGCGCVTACSCSDASVFMVVVDVIFCESFYRLP